MSRHLRLEVVMCLSITILLTTLALALPPSLDLSRRTSPKLLNSGAIQLSISAFIVFAWYFSRVPLCPFYLAIIDCRNDIPAFEIRSGTNYCKRLVCCLLAPMRLSKPAAAQITGTSENNR